MQHTLFLTPLRKSRVTILALIALLAIFSSPSHHVATASADEPIPTTPVGVQLAWTLTQLNGGASTLTDSDVLSHVSPALLAVLPPPAVVATLQELAGAGPFAFLGFTRTPTDRQGNALLLGASGMPFVLPIAVEPVAPYLIVGLSLAPVPPPAGTELTPYKAGSDPSRFDGLVSIGDRRIEISCRGTGSPTVLLESGLGDPAAPWFGVESAVANFTRVCSYDRTNTVASASDPSVTPRTGLDDAADLTAVLKAAAIPGPYVLVGHSIGSHVIRLFAGLNPSLTAGLVLVDPTHEDQDVRRKALVDPSQFAVLQAILSANAEGMDLDATAAQVSRARANGNLPPVPLVVVSAGMPDDGSGFPPGWPMAAEARLHGELQSDLASLVPNGKQIVAGLSTHYVHQSQPQLVVNAIKDVVTVARSRAAASEPLLKPAP